MAAALAGGLSPEAMLEAAVPLERRKRIGQFFTPEPVAAAMARWALRGRQVDRLLDPACGPGIFLRHANMVSSRPAIVAYDTDAAALGLARQWLASAAGPADRVELRNEDFLTASVDGCFDAVLCNPPYVRHHDARTPEAVFRWFDAQFRTRISRLTNVYCLFMLRILRLLSPRGRAAVITPAEFLNADFGKAIKQALLNSDAFAGMIIFNHARAVFSGVMTTAAITLLDRSAPADPVVFVHGGSVCKVDDCFAAHGGGRNGLTVRRWPRGKLDPSAKWTALTVHKPAPRVAYPTVSRADGKPHMRTATACRTLGDVATCMRGIATGANHFFTLTRAEASEWNLPADALRPCITKALHARDAVFTRRHYDALAAANKKALLLCAESETDPRVRRYLAHGVSLGLHKRYLTRNRNPWYRTERRAPADLWVTVFGRKELRFVHNQAGILSLTTFHSVYVREPHRHRIESLLRWFASAEFRRQASLQTRVYGDGLLKLEPRDVLRLPLPAHW